MREDAIDLNVLARLAFGLVVPTAVLALVASGCDSSSRVSSERSGPARESSATASPLTVVEALTPRFPVPRYDTSGTYPQVRGGGHDLSAVNTALRRVVLADQQRYASSARAAAKVAGKDARGVYQTSVDRRLLSASTVVVSVLMPAIELYPGGTEGSGWVSGTVRVPPGAAVRLTDLFARPSGALPVLAREWKAQYRLTHPSMVCVTQLPSLYTPSASNYRNFALLPSGLAIGIHGHASCAGLQATVPYARLRPYLSKLGATLIAGVRGSRNVGPPPGVTSYGRLLWNFEALLRDTFGNRSAVSATTGLNDSLNFSCAGWCGPNAKYLHYRFTFAQARGSAFHVSRKRYVGGTWGNYPRGILIRGHLIACDARETEYLISWVFRSTASFTLGCGGDPLGR